MEKILSSSTPSTDKVETAIVSQSIETDVTPGTVLLVDLEAGHEDIVLSPQPSDDPNDPLNWSKTRKYVNVFMVLFYVFCAGGIGVTSVYPVYVEIQKDTGIPLADLNTGTGVLFLLAGWGLLFFMPLAQKIGRRPVYLISLAGCLIMSELIGRANSSGAYITYRLLYGFFLAVVEALPEICITEIFFAHERGTWIGLYMMVLSGASYLGPIISAGIQSAFGWRGSQHWAAILLGVNFLLALFFQEESLYYRSSGETDLSGDSISGLLTVNCKREFDESITRRTLVQRLSPLTVNHHVTNKQLFRMVWEPLYILFWFPLVLWGGFAYGIGLSWYNVYNATANEIFASPPYSFSSAVTGFTFFAPLIGSLLAGIYSGPVSDWMMLKLAKKNNGIREPEQRLWGFTAYVVTCGAGLFLWGLGAAHSIHWIGLCFGGLSLGFAIVLAGVFPISYTVDSYRGISFSAVTSLILVRNSMSFAFNYGITPWINAQGLSRTFVVAGVLSIVTGLTFLLPIWKGKKLRKVSASRYNKLTAQQIINH